MKRIYLAGPMRGIKDFNFPAFHSAAAFLRSQGHIVFNPAEHDESKYGKGFNKSKTGDFKDIPQFDLRKALTDDINYILKEATDIALLQGWENSTGAKTELSVAKSIGLGVIELGDKETILQEAIRLVGGARQSAYGHPFDDYTRTVQAFNALTGLNITVSQGVVFMICVKLSRESHHPKRDNRVDGAGYFQCLDMVREKESNHGKS